MFVKQYRKAAEDALVEVIAGGLEAGEDPIEGAKRETDEETGYLLKGDCPHGGCARFTIENAPDSPLKARQIHHRKRAKFTIVLTFLKVL